MNLSLKPTLYPYLIHLHIAEYKGQEGLSLVIEDFVYLKSIVIQKNCLDLMKCLTLKNLYKLTTVEIQTNCCQNCTSFSLSCI